MAAIAMVGPGAAEADYNASYTITLDAGIPDVTDLTLFRHPEHQYSRTSKTPGSLI